MRPECLPSQSVGIGTDALQSCAASSGTDAGLRAGKALAANRVTASAMGVGAGCSTATGHMVLPQPSCVLHRDRTHATKQGRSARIGLFAALRAGPVQLEGAPSDLVRLEGGRNASIYHVVRHGRRSSDGRGTRNRSRHCARDGRLRRPTNRYRVPALPQEFLRAASHPLSRDQLRPISPDRPLHDSSRRCRAPRGFDRGA